MCVLSIELVWVEIYGKMGEKKTTISGHFRGLVLVPNSGTGTKQCGTGTTCVLVNWYRYGKVGTCTQCSVLDQSVPVPNVMFWTSVSVLAITWSFLIRFE